MASRWGLTSATLNRENERVWNEPSEVSTSGCVPIEGAARSPSSGEAPEQWLNAAEAQNEHTTPSAITLHEDGDATQHAY